MKKYLIVSILSLVSCFAMTQNIYRIYKPLRGNLIGCTIDYDKSSSELSVKENKLDSLTTSPSSASYDKYSKNANIAVIAFNRTVGKITTIEPLGNVFIDKVFSLKGIISEGTPFIYSGLRADSAKITYVKTASTDISPTELIKEIGKLVGTNADWLSVNWIDSVKHTFNDTLHITVSNPNVYFEIEMSKFKNLGISARKIPKLQRSLHPEYYKTFNGINASQQAPVTLNLDGDTTSISCETQGVNPTCKVTLFIYKSDKGEIQLKAITNFENYNAKIISPNIGSSSWDITDLPIGVYNTSTNLFVELKIDVKAKKVGDSIKIVESYLTYPTYELTSYP